MNSCPNCQAQLSGRYCSSCGQDNLRDRLDSKAVLASTVHNLVGWDSALALTLRGLVTRPGQLAADYSSGRRRSFVNPARFCLLALALWFFIGQAAGIDVLGSTGFQTEITKGQGKWAEIGDELNRFLGSYINVLLYLALPALALFLRVAFRKSNRNLAECLVLVLYLGGFRFIVSTLLFPFEYSAPLWAKLARLGLEFVWAIWAAKDFFEVGLWTALWRASLCKLLHIVATVVFFGAVAFVWLRLTHTG